MIRKTEYYIYNRKLKVYVKVSKATFYRKIRTGKKRSLWTGKLIQHFLDPENNGNTE